MLLDNKKKTKFISLTTQSYWLRDLNSFKGKKLYKHNLLTWSKMLNELEMELEAFLTHFQHADSFHHLSYLKIKVACKK